MTAITELVGSILVDIGNIALAAALLLYRWYIKPEMNKLNLPFWQYMLFMGEIMYWKTFLDFKHRFLLVLAYILLPLGLVLIAYGGGWLNGHPFFWYEWL